MSGPANNYFRKWIKNSWTQTSPQVKLGTTGAGIDVLNLACFDGAAAAAGGATYAFDTDSGYGTAPWNTNEINGTGTSAIPSGGLACTVSGVTVSSGSIAIKIAALQIGPNCNIAANGFDTFLLYDVTASNLGIACYSLGTYYSLTSPNYITIDFQNSPQTDTAFYGS